MDFALFVGCVFIAANVYLFVRSAHSLFLVQKMFLLDFMVLLHLSAAAGGLTYFLLKFQYEGATLIILSVVVITIAFSGGLWGHSQAVQNRTLPRSIGILIGLLTPFVCIGVVPITANLFVRHLWLFIPLEVILFVIYIIGVTRLCRKQGTNAT